MRKLLLLASAVLFAAPARAEIAWRPDLATAHAEAMQSGKLLLVHFYKDNCVWCDKVEQGVYGDSSVAAAVHSQFIPVRVNGPRDPKYVAAFSVMRYPTEVIVAPEDGKILFHDITPQDASRYLAMLQAPEVSARLGQSVSAPQAPVSVGSAAAREGQGNTGKNWGADSVQTPAPVAAGTLGFPTGTKYNPQVAGPGAAMEGVTMPPGIAEGNFDMPSYSGSFDGVPHFGGTPAMAAGFAGLAPPANAGAAENEQTQPAQQATAPESHSASKPQATATNKLPPEAMEGYCPVTVIEQGRWERGNPAFGVIHLGQLYLFADAAAKKKFQDAPQRYTPVLNGIDVVKFFDQRVVVQGSREWGYTDPLYGRMFLFADEASMNHFYLHFERYTKPAIDLMERAAAEANAQQ